MVFPSSLGRHGRHGHGLGLYFFYFLMLCIFIDFHSCTQVIFHQFDVRYFPGEPNGVRTQILGVNRQFPGPTIYADVGDLLIVNVTNNIQTKENTSIHWHGLEMYQELFEDGPEYVTQCQIVYGGYQIYQFQLKQAGTYWWHSHHAGQYTEGYWGSLIIRNKPEIQRYNDEMVIALSDWYHEFVPAITNWYLSRFSEGRPPIPHSILINGKGFYPCIFAEARGRTCSRDQKYTVFHVHQHTTLRLRIINTAAMVTTSFSIDNHKLQVIEVDGVDTVLSDPVDVITLAPAQRYSVLVYLDQDIRDYWIRVKAIDTPILTPNANQDPFAFDPEIKAIWRYKPYIEFPVTGDEVSTLIATQGRPPTHDGGRALQFDPIPAGNLTQLIQLANKAEFKSKSKQAAATKSMIVTYETLFSRNLPNTTEPANPVELDEKNCRPYDGISSPTYYDQEIVINAELTDIGGGMIRWAFNKKVYTMSPNHEPALYQILHEREVSSGFNPIKTTFGRRKVIQLVINNRGGGTHPFHIHGHTFWVLGMGEPGADDYNHIRDEKKLRMDGVRRDTLTVNPFSWTVVRYYADNPGTWLFHCHINWHLQAGLGLVFIEGEDTIRSFTRLPKEWKDVCKRAGLNVSAL